MQERDLVTIALAVLLAASVGILVPMLLAARRRVRAAEDESERLRVALGQQGSPYSSRTARTAHRAVKTVVETATRVRDQGVGGLLMSSIEDLTRWALEDRPEITRIAAPDGTATIFFSDIEGSTALNERLGDDAWVKLLGAHDTLVRGRVEAHGGHIVKSQGDGFMVVFRSPAEAARAGLDIQAALEDGRGRALRRTPIRVRIGMHTGPVVARDGDYFGRNVARAARVGAQAEGGQILVTDEVQRALAGDAGLALAAEREVELKGLPGSHRLWSVRRA